jgi:NADPH:quinone reductase-like Zn-dependent oxidoreductase
VRRATHNVGVRVVLNSLAGQHQDLGVAVLRPGGTFLEIVSAINIGHKEMMVMMILRRGGSRTTILS